MENWKTKAKRALAMVFSLVIITNCIPTSSFISYADDTSDPIIDMQDSEVEDIVVDSDDPSPEDPDNESELPDPDTSPNPDPTNPNVGSNPVTPVEPSAGDPETNQDPDEENDGSVSGEDCVHENKAFSYKDNGFHSVSCADCEAVLDDEECTKVFVSNDDGTHKVLCSKCENIFETEEFCVDDDEDLICDECGFDLSELYNEIAAFSLLGGAEECTHENLRYEVNSDNVYTHNEICEDCGEIVRDHVACKDEDSDTFCDKCGNTMPSLHAGDTCINCGSGTIVWQVKADGAADFSTPLGSIDADGGWHMLACDNCGYCDPMSRCSFTETEHSYAGGWKHLIQCDVCLQTYNVDCNKIMKPLPSGSAYYLTKHVPQCSLCNGHGGTAMGDISIDAGNIPDDFINAGMVSVEDHTLTITPNNDGTHTYSCSECGLNAVRDCTNADGKKPNESGSWVDNGDGETHGFTCSVCGYHPSEPHTFTATDNGDGTHTLTCSKCGYSKVENCTMSSEYAPGVRRNDCCSHVDSSLYGVHYKKCSVCGHTVAHEAFKTNTVKPFDPSDPEYDQYYDTHHKNVCTVDDCTLYGFDTEYSYNYSHFLNGATYEYLYEKLDPSDPQYDTHHKYVKKAVCSCGYKKVETETVQSHSCSGYPSSYDSVNGKVLYPCSDCGYVKEERIIKLVLSNVLNYSGGSVNETPASPQTLYVPEGTVRHHYKYYTDPLLASQNGRRSVTPGSLPNMTHLGYYVVTGEGENVQSLQIVDNRGNIVATPDEIFEIANGATTLIATPKYKNVSNKITVNLDGGEGTPTTMYYFPHAYGDLGNDYVKGLYYVADDIDGLAYPYVGSYSKQYYYYKGLYTGYNGTGTMVANHDGTNGVGTGTFVLNANEVTSSNDGNYTLYVNWQEYYNLTFKAEGSSISEQKANVDFNGTSLFGNDFVTPVTITSPTKSGYTFAGWWTEADGGTEFVPGTTVATYPNLGAVQENHKYTLYAHWVDAEITGGTLSKIEASSNKGGVSGVALPKGNITVNKYYDLTYDNGETEEDVLGYFADPSDPSSFVRGQTSPTDGYTIDRTTYPKQGESRTVTVRDANTPSVSTTCSVKIAYPTKIEASYVGGTKEAWDTLSDSEFEAVRLWHLEDGEDFSLYEGYNENLLKVPNINLSTASLLQGSNSITVTDLDYATYESMNASYLKTDDVNVNVNTQINVSFKNINGDVVQEETYAYGSAVSVPGSVSCHNMNYKYTFQQYALAYENASGEHSVLTGANVPYAKAELVTGETEYNKQIKAKSVSYEAYYSTDPVPYRYVWVDENDQELESVDGSLAEVTQYTPQDPTKEGFSFSRWEADRDVRDAYDEWYENGEDLSSPIVITFKAKFTEIAKPTPTPDPEPSDDPDPDPTPDPSEEPAPEPTPDPPTPTPIIPPMPTPDPNPDPTPVIPPFPEPDPDPEPTPIVEDFPVPSPVIEDVPTPEPTPVQEDSEPEPERPKISRTVVSTLIAGGITVALVTSGGFNYLWMLIFCLLNRKRRIRFHGFLSDEKLRFVQSEINDSDTEQIELVQEVADRNENLADFIEEMMSTRNATYVPANTKMTVSFVDSNGELVSNTVDANEEEMFKMIQAADDMEVMVDIFNSKCGWDIELKFDFSI